MNAKHFVSLTIFITFLLLIWGGVVHNTESSLACPDWPLCYGQFFPLMKGGILIEHGHRLLASLVGFLTIILVVLTHKKRKISEAHQEVSKLSNIALAFVIIQGLLGGITVIYKLPTIVSTSHLGLSMVFFGTLILIFQKLAAIEKPLLFDDQKTLEEFKNSWNPNVRMGVLIGGIFLYGQILLGAFMRHSGAGAACGLGPKSAFLCMNSETWQTTFWPSWMTAQLHMTHRYFAIFVTLFLTYYCFKVISFFIRNKELNKKFKMTYSLLPLGIVFLLFLQVVLGILTVTNNLSVIPTTAHLGIGALCLGTTWYLNLKLKWIEESLFKEKVYSLAGDIIDLAKPKLSGLVMVTVLVGLLLAPGDINFFFALYALFLIAMVVMGGAILNCYIEKDIDKLMERTKDRSLPAGRLNPKVALVLGVVLLMFSVPALVIQVNYTTGFMALLAAVLYLYAYTPMKQKSDVAVYVGAIPGAIPPLLGWTAVTGHLDGMAWSLFAILFIWQIPHFFAISIYRAEDYDAASIKVYSNQKGITNTERFIFVFTAVLFGCSLLPAILGDASAAYLKAAVVLSGVFLLFSSKGLILGSSPVIHRRWARQYFWGSIFYLPLLLCAIIFLR